MREGDDRRVEKPMVGLQRALARSVRDALDASGNTQANLAALIGMSEKHVSQMLNGTAMGSLAVWNLMLFTVEVDTVRIVWQALDKAEARLKPSTYFDTVRSLTEDPAILAAVDAAEQAM